MKKLIIIFVMIVGAAGIFFYFRGGTTKSTVEPGTSANNTFKPDPSSATFKFDGESITLSQGENITTDPETGATEETELLDERAYGDINNDKKPDTIVFLTRSGGGSGVFVYAAAYISGPVNYKGTNAVFLGDRISPTSISFANGVATIKYLDRGPDEPFAAEPTITVSKQFVYKNGEFQEK